MGSGRRSARQVARIGALAALTFALGAAPAPAEDNEFGFTGTVVDGNIAVGGQTGPQPPGVGSKPFAFFSTPTLQPAGAHVFDDDGWYEAFAPLSGLVYALRNVTNGPSHISAFSASGAAAVACDDDGVSDPLDGVFAGMFTSDDHLFLFGHTGGSDAAKLILRLDHNCQPAPGGAFGPGGRMTLNPTNGFDLFTAGEYETLGSVGIIALVGSENGDGEVDLFDEDGGPLTAFDGDGSLTIDLTGTLNFFDLELIENGNGMLDAFDRVFFAGQHASDALIGVTDGTGAPPPGTWCGTTGTDAITQIFDIAPGAVSNFIEGLAAPGSALFAGGTVITPQFQFDALVNAYSALNLCDLSSSMTQSWVRVLDGIEANDNDVGTILPLGNRVFVIGSMDNPQTQSFDAFLAGPYDEPLQRGGFRVIDLTPDTGQGPGPGPGTPVVPTPPDGSLPGDFNLDGAVDAADYVVWRKSRVGVGGVRVRIQTPDGVREGDSTEAYNEWRANFGRSSASQRRRAGVVFARNRTTLRGRQSKLVRIPLTRAGKRLIRRYDGRRLRARLLLRVTYRPASGGPVQKRTFRQAVRLRVVKPRRRG